MAGGKTSLSERSGKILEEMAFRCIKSHEVLGAGPRQVGEGSHQGEGAVITQLLGISHSDDRQSEF